MSYEKLEQLYEGKAKKVFATSDPNVVIVSYKDDATAFNGLKKGTITGKGAINNRMTNNLMRRLEEKGVPTHYVEELSDRETAVKKVSIVPLEVIIRNISAGSFAKRFGVEEGIVSCAHHRSLHKNDDLRSLANSYHALLSAGYPGGDRLIKKYALRSTTCWVGSRRRRSALICGLLLSSAKHLTAPLCWPTRSPDTCRLWDEQTTRKLDKATVSAGTWAGAEEADEEVASA